MHVAFMKQTLKMSNLPCDGLCDIRRIRKHLIPCGDGKFVKIDYCELLKMFDEIETKAKKLAEKEKKGD